MSSKRRNAIDVLISILEYLNNVNRPVTLNDIALGTSTNTNVVQRWLSIISVSQFSDNLVFDDNDGQKITITEKIDYFPGYIIKPIGIGEEMEDVEDEFRKIKLEKSIYEGNWKIDPDTEIPDLIIISDKSLKIEYDYISTLETPVIIWSYDVSRANCYFYVHGFNERRTVIPLIEPISLPILKFMASSFLGTIRVLEKQRIHEALPYLVSQEGYILSTIENEDLFDEELIHYVRQLAKMIVDTDNVVQRHEIWASIFEDPDRMEELMLSDYGEYFVVVLEYLLIKNVSDLELPYNYIDWTITHFWRAATLARLGFLTELDAANLVSYIKTNNTLKVRILYVLFYFHLNPYIDDIIELYQEHDYIIDETNFNPSLVLSKEDDIESLTKFYLMLYDLIIPLFSLKTNFNWRDFGRVHSIYVGLDTYNYPFLKYYILDKLADSISFDESYVFFLYSQLKHAKNLKSLSNYELTLYKLVREELKRGNFHKCSELTNELIQIKGYLSSSEYEIAEEASFVILIRMFNGEFFLSEASLDFIDQSENLFSKLILLQYNILVNNLNPEFLFGAKEEFHTGPQVISDDIFHLLINRTKRIVKSGRVENIRLHELEFMILHPMTELINILALVEVPKFYNNVGLKKSCTTIQGLRELIKTKKGELKISEYDLDDVPDLTNDNSIELITKTVILELLFQASRKFRSKQEVRLKLSKHRDNLKESVSKVYCNSLHAPIKLYLAMNDHPGMLLKRDYNSFIGSVFPNIKLPEQKIHPLNLLWVLMIRNYISDEI